jgi:GntR family transcriptional regulator of vanillate catabolism
LDTENAASSGQTLEGDSQLGRTVLRLREMILKGEFGPGERISEYPLTHRLEVSRTPIRLALERLAHEGLLESYPTGGFIVRKFTLDDIWNGIEVRSLLEGGAARLAAERLVDDRELDHLRKSQQDIDVMGEPTIDMFPAFLELNDRFHSEVMNLAKNEMLRQALDRLFSFPLTSPRILVSFGPKWTETSQLFIISQEQHHRLFEAISRKQGARAESIAREHAFLARRNLEIALADIDFLSSLPGGPLVKL